MRIRASGARTFLQCFLRPHVHFSELCAGKENSQLLMETETPMQRTTGARDQPAPTARRRSLPAGRSSLPPLPLNHEYQQTIALMERRIGQARRGGDVRILEAGCGARWTLRLEGIPYKLTAVDIDKEALEIRKTGVRDVDEIRVGDLRNGDLFAPESFDVIYNSYVLEHVKGAEQVLDNFVRWLAPGGLLILKIPDRDSVYGLLARSTPFWVHVLYKRYVEGLPNAGQPGYGPYPTHYDTVVSRRGIHRYCSTHGCRVEYEAGFGGYLPKRPVVRAFALTVVKTIAALSFGRVDWRHNNLTFVIEKLPGESVLRSHQEADGETLDTTPPHQRLRHAKI
jgi:SAM-dependent methyltransferase